MADHWQYLIIGMLVGYVVFLHVRLWLAYRECQRLQKWVEALLLHRPDPPALPVKSDRTMWSPRE